MMIGACRLTDSFQLGSEWVDVLHSAVSIEKLFALVQHDGKGMLVACRRNDCAPVRSGDLDDRTKVLIKDASLLSHPKDQVFCTPRAVV